MTRMKAPDILVTPVLEFYGIEVRRGKALCKWHTEKTPSLSVTPNGLGFRCWSCGKSGDAIALIREEEDMNFEDALARAAEIVGGTGQPVPPEPADRGWWSSPGSSLLG